MAITKIDHVAIVVPDLEEGARFWVEGLGLAAEKTENITEQKVNVTFLPVGESHLELLEATDEESGVARYLRSRGPGLHHICLQVDDIEAMLARLQELDIPLIDNTPRIDRHGTRLAFVHPAGTGGVLVEFYELAT